MKSELNSFYTEKQQEDALKKSSIKTVDDLDEREDIEDIDDDSDNSDDDRGEILRPIRPNQNIIFTEKDPSQVTKPEDSATEQAASDNSQAASTGDHPA